MTRCADCGTVIERSGICSNCHEELYILTYQSEFVDSVSEEFAQKADEQQQSIKERRHFGIEGGQS